jgi:hypothetical protein
MTSRECGDWVETFYARITIGRDRSTGDNEKLRSDHEYDHSRRERVLRDMAHSKRRYGAALLQGLEITDCAAGWQRGSQSAELRIEHRDRIDLSCRRHAKSVGGRGHAVHGGDAGRQVRTKSGIAGGRRSVDWVRLGSHHRRTTRIASRDRSRALLSRSSPI